MVAALFLRADHPDGWGMGQRAHGFSAVVVLCPEGASQLDAVIAAMRDFKGLAGAGERNYSAGYLGDWYGGQFQLVSSFETEGALDVQLVDAGPGVRYRSLGDNRYIGVFGADEVLSD